MRRLAAAATRDRARNEVMFASDARAALTSCVYVPLDCFDRCAKGDAVDGFGCGPLDTTPPRP